MDTIRSRCLNFRIPVAAETIAHPDWTRWADDYQNWLNGLLDNTGRNNVPHIVLGSYGLNLRFQAILADLTEQSWKLRKEQLPEHVSSEEKEAIESGISRRYRKQLFGEIEKVTIQFARTVEVKQPGNLPVTALNRATQVLEKCAGLLELNFNQSAALELFFLQSMRIWTHR